ncbi:hypothetical protein [Fontivita pretiosa]|uniref:hypothetical protein n=1 Tax=Fontivita pretiosa TaxID=2989684 RepID=UPI003D165939
MFTHLLRTTRAMALSAAIGTAIGAMANAQTPAQPPQAPQPAAAAQPQQADVPVRAVVLFSSGVGYFEHFGTVHGDGSTELRFKTAQINDILKSLVLQDLDGGQVSTVTYPSQDPISKILKSFQVDITNNPPLADLLNQLRGARLSVTAQAEKLTGTILGVETRRKPVEKGEPVQVAVLNLLTGASIRSIELETINSLVLEDPQLQEELNKALAALAQARDQDKKPVTINFRGEGERRVRIGYVVETPIWKTSYRLIMDDQQGGKLQGWAIVENQTDSDWNNVQLSLVSGRPISFIMDLYQPLYVPRPVVEPELWASLRPPTHEGAIAQDKRAEPLAVAGAPARRARGGAVGAGQPPAAAAAPQLALESADRTAEQLGRPMDVMASVQSVASAAQIGELFQYTVGNVTLPRQKSAMLPIIADNIEVERVSIYNSSVLPRHPLNGARIRNTTDKHLLQGPITVLDAGNYAGDARIENLPPGQERLLSYGIDLQMLVDSTQNRSETAILTGKIVKGVLYLSRRHLATQEYLANNKSDRDKTLIIEHPIRQGWKLVDTEKPIETTQTLYRFKGTVGAGKASKLVVKEEIVQGETIAILPAEIEQLLFYARNGQIPKEVRDAIGKAVELKQALAETERQIAEHEQRINAITQEQGRIRENMKTVDRNSQYYNRLLTKLNEQESQIEKLQSEREQLEQKRNAQRKELEDYLAGLDIG